MLVQQLLRPNPRPTLRHPHTQTHPQLPRRPPSPFPPSSLRGTEHTLVVGDPSASGWEHVEQSLEEIRRLARSVHGASSESMLWNGENCTSAFAGRLTDEGRPRPPRRPAPTSASDGPKAPSSGDSRVDRLTAAITAVQQLRSFARTSLHEPPHMHVLRQYRAFCCTDRAMAGGGALGEHPLAPTAACSAHAAA